jgi:S-formylglutathione hydrolase
VLYRAIDDVLDAVITQHRAAEMIVVMPDGWSRYGCSQWVDSPVNGNFEQYVTQEVVAYVDSHYRTIASPESRGIVGISSGGLGAWHLGSRHPDVFGGMVLLSADSYFDLTHKPWL